MKKKFFVRSIFVAVFTVLIEVVGAFAAQQPPVDVEALLRRDSLPVMKQASEQSGQGQVSDASWQLIEEYYRNSQGNNAPMPEVSQRAIDDQNLATNWLDVERKEDLIMREIDKKAMELVKEFQRAEGVATPTHGGNGAVRIAYSSYTPKVMCRPMRVTDIMLQSGETVTGVHAGDTVRWTYTPGTSGSGENAVTHVMVKPLAPDITTNLIVHTDRRVYNFDLVSSSSEFFPSMSFAYPEEELRKWKAFIENKRQADAGKVTLGEGVGVNPENLNFNYEIRGSAQPWKPIRVWDDGKQVYIQMPKGWNRSGVEAPVLLVYEKRKERMVNYRVKGDIVICDTLFKEKCALIAGTGSQQDRVVILRKN